MSIIEELLSLKIDKAYCISIDKNKDKQLQILKECRQINQEFDFLLVEKNEKDPVLGCLSSHIQCIMDAKINNYKNVMIMEDDVVFNMDIITLIKNTYKIKVPDIFDMFFLGYNINEGYRHNIGVMKLLSAQAAHCYIINERVYDYILENVKLDWVQQPEWNMRYELERYVNFNCRAIDLFYAKFVNSRNHSYGIYPIIANQRPGYSEIENKMVEYNTLMAEKSIKFYSKYIIDFPILVLNLDRRQDRYKTFLEMSQHYLTKIHRISAVDGKTFDFKKFLGLFDTSHTKGQKKIKNPYPDHNFRKGILGCSLSHYFMWKYILNNDSLDDNDFVLILEDDIEYDDEFVYKLNNGLRYLVTDEKWDVTYVGYTDYKNTNDKKINDMFIEFSGDRRVHGGGTFAYFIRKKGARKLFECANKHHMKQAVDWFMIEHYDEVISYKFEPELIFSKVATDINDDSDVQLNDDRLLYLNLELEQVQINNELLYLAKNTNILFIYDEYHKIYDVYGRFDGKQIIKQKLNPSHVRLNISRTNPALIVYVGKNKLEIKYKLFCEDLANKHKNFDIYCFCETYDMIYNNVKYISYEKINKMCSAIKAYKLLIFDITYCFENNIPDYSQLFIDRESFYNTYENILLKDNGKYIFQNLIGRFEKVYTFSDTLLEDFKLYTGLEPTNMSLIKYNLDNIIPRQKKMQLISYDKCIENIIPFYKKLKVVIPELELVLYSNEHKINGITIYKRQNIEDRFELEVSKFFITTDLNNEFNILNAMKAGCICLIPNYFNVYKNKCILYDVLDNDFVDNFCNIITNESIMNMITTRSLEYISQYL